jgi:hypothetical protein
MEPPGAVGSQRLSQRVEATPPGFTGCCPRPIRGGLASCRPSGHGRPCSCRTRDSAPRARFVLGLVISVQASACHPAAAPSPGADRGTCDDVVRFTVTSRREGALVHVEDHSEHVCPARGTKHLPIASIDQREPGCPVGQEAFVVHGGEVFKREGVGAEAHPNVGRALLEASRKGLASSRALALSCQPGHLAVAVRQPVRSPAACGPRRRASLGRRASRAGQPEGIGVKPLCRRKAN